MNEFTVIVIYVLLTIAGAIGALFLKKGSKHVNTNIFSLIENKELQLGIFFFVFPTLIYIYLLKLVDLSVLYPLSSLTYVWVPLLSIKFLKESMNKYKWLGIVFIVLGAIMTTYS